MVDMKLHNPSFHHNTAMQIYLLAVAIFLAIFSCTMIIIIIYSLCKYDKPAKAKTKSMRAITRTSSMGYSFVKKVKLVNYPTILSALFYFISSCLFFFVLSQFDPMDNNNFGNDPQFVLYMLSFGGCVFLAKLSIYAQFLARLYTSFKNSYLAPKKVTIIFSIILLIILFLCIIWWMVLISVRYIWLNKEFPSYNTQFYFVFGGLLLFDFIVSWLVVGLFIAKLFQSVMLRSRSEFYEKTQRLLMGYDDKIDYVDRSTKSSTASNPTLVEDEVEPYNVEERRKSRMGTFDQIDSRGSMMMDVAFASIDETDQKRLDLITRQLLLSIMSIMTSQIGYVTIIIILVIRDTAHTSFYNDRVQTELYGIFAGVFYPMDMILNLFVLYLSYKFAIKYYKCCCKFCHRRCKLCVLRKAAKQINKKYMAMNSESVGSNFYQL